jgi:pilus assembly protein CpaF
VHGGYQDGRVLGSLQPTGIRPKFTDKIREAGIELPAELFGQTFDVTAYRK